MTLQKKNKKDFSYSSRKQNDLGVPGFFLVQKQVMRARLYYTSIEFRESCLWSFWWRVTRKKSCQGTSVKRLPFTIHVHFQIAQNKGKGCSQQWKYTHVQQGMLVLSKQPQCDWRAPTCPESSWVQVRALAPCVPTFEGASSHLYETVLSGPCWNFSEKRLSYNGDMAFLSQETPLAPFLPFLSMCWDFLCFSFLFKKVKLYIYSSPVGD